MISLTEFDLKKITDDARLHRRALILAYFLDMSDQRWQGVDQEGLVNIVESIHGKLAVLGSQGMRDPMNLEALKLEITEELPQLKVNIDGTGGDVYDLLLSLAKGVVNTPVPPLSAHRPA